MDKRTFKGVAHVAMSLRWGVKLLLMYVFIRTM